MRTHIFNIKMSARERRVCPLILARLFSLLLLLVFRITFDKHDSRTINNKFSSYLLMDVVALIMIVFRYISVAQPIFYCFVTIHLCCVVLVLLFYLSCVCPPANIYHKRPTKQQQQQQLRVKSRPYQFK